MAGAELQLAELECQALTEEAKLAITSRRGGRQGGMQADRTAVSAGPAPARPPRPSLARQQRSAARRIGKM